MRSSDSALDAAVRVFGPQRGHEMLGCDWGTTVALADDREVCTRQARQRVVLHGPDGAHAVKVCAEHAVRVEALTDPHAEEVAGA